MPRCARCMASPSRPRGSPACRVSLAARPRGRKRWSGSRCHTPVARPRARFGPGASRSSRKREQRLILIAPLPATPPTPFIFQFRISRGSPHPLYSSRASDRSSSVVSSELENDTDPADSPLPLQDQCSRSESRRSVDFRLGLDGILVNFPLFFFYFIFFEKFPLNFF